MVEAVVACPLLTKMEPEEMEQVVLDAIKVNPSPSQYLRSKYNTDDMLKEFANQLRATFPQRDDVTYFDRKNIPQVNPDRAPGDGIYILEIFNLGFDKECSLKPAVSKKVAAQLWQEYCVDGFVTNDQPLIIFQPPQKQSGIN